MTNHSAPLQRIPWRTWLLLIAIACIIRGGVLWGMRGGLYDDPDGYRELAETLSSENTYARKTMLAWKPTALEPTAYRPPLYPLLLANYAQNGLVSPTRVAVLHLLLGVGSVLITFQIARMWNLDQHAAVVAAVLVAADPILLRQSTLVMTETLATFLTLTALWCLTRLSQSRDFFYAALAGAALGLCALCRPTFFAWLPLCVVVVPLLAGSALRRIINTVVLIAAATLVIAPWAARNNAELGTPVIATTHGGYTFVLGNNRHFYEHLRKAPWGEVWDAQASPLRREIFREFRMTGPVHYEVDLDRAAFRMAIQSIEEQPDMFAWSCLVRVGRLWNPLPHRVTPDETTTTLLLRYAVAGGYLIVFALALIGLNKLRTQMFRTPWLWGVLLCVAFTAVHVLFWSNMRMRAPLMPVVALAAGVGVGACLAKRRKTQLFTT